MFFEVSFVLGRYPLYFLRNEGIFVATLDIKEGEMGVSDFNFILTSSVATWVWMLPFNHKLAPL